MEITLDECVVRGYLTAKGTMKRTLTTEEKTLVFIAKSREVHGSLYNYPNSTYTLAKNTVEIACQIHGAFYQKANNHQNGLGCPSCAGNSRLTTRECIRDFMKIHGDTYNYSKVHYLAQDIKVDIVCNIHGIFSQSPNKHKNGRGCPKCSGIAHDVIYLWRLIGTNTYKVGVTTSSSKYRRITSVAKLHGVRPDILLYHKCTDPLLLEKIVKDTYSEYRSIEISSGEGYTEMFDLTEAQVTEIKEFILS